MSQYPDPDDATITARRWAWEFLRRNVQYQKDYVRLPKLSNREVFNPPEGSKEYLDACGCYRIRKLANPEAELDETDLEFLFPVEVQPVAVCGPRSGEDPVMNFGNLAETEIIFRLYLDLPFEMQLPLLKATFEEKRKKLLKESPQRPRNAEFCNYLRLLDARNEGASWSQIVEVIDPLTDVSSLRSKYVTAKRLADIGYLSLIYSEDSERIRKSLSE